MMTKTAPAFVKPRTQIVAPDKLDKITKLVTEAQLTDQLITELEAQLAAASKRFNDIVSAELPDLLDEAGVMRVTTTDIDVKLRPFYAANISVKWPEAQRRKAFDWLEANGHGDLIKTEVSILYPRGDHNKAVQMLDSLAVTGLAASIKETIPHATLTAWLKEQVEKYSTTPPLDLIGGVVGRIAKIKEVDK